MKDCQALHESPPWGVATACEPVVFDLSPMVVSTLMSLYLLYIFFGALSSHHHLLPTHVPASPFLPFLLSSRLVLSAQRLAAGSWAAACLLLRSGFDWHQLRASLLCLLHLLGGFRPAGETNVGRSRRSVACHASWRSYLFSNDPVHASREGWSKARVLNDSRQTLGNVKLQHTKSICKSMLC